MQIEVTRELASALKKYLACKENPEDTAYEVFNYPYSSPVGLLEACEVAECVRKLVTTK
jgi:hypothetical protein